MPRNPQQHGFFGRRARAEEEIRQLRIRGNLPPNTVDLSDYLDTGWAAVEYFDSDGPFAVIYREGSRVWMAGSVFYTDAGHSQSTALLGTPLPAEFRPGRSLTNVTFDFDWEDTTWTPPPDGVDSDATVGARIQADVTRAGYINFESEIANYQGRARHDSGTLYNGVPDGSTLILEGISWIAADPL